MTHIGLFEGIGGFSLAARWIGWQTVAWCEWDEMCQRHLRYHFPEAEGFGDITQTDFTKYADTIDILTGGFPCQPFSQAGKRKGTADTRYLWPEMLRAIREIRPRWIVGENVRGLVNWDGGLVFDTVQADLEAQGYEVLPFLLPACAVDAPHRRDRVWFVAHADGKFEEHRRGKDTATEGEVRRDETGDVFRELRGAGTAADPSSQRTTKGAGGFNKSRELFSAAERDKNKFQYQPTGAGELTPDPSNERLQFSGPTRTGRTGFEDGDCGGFTANSNGQRQNTAWKPAWMGRHRPMFDNSPGTQSTWQNFPTQPPVCGRNDGLPSQLDGTTFSKWRQWSIKSYGNAVVPQVVFQIYKAIQQYQSL